MDGGAAVCTLAAFLASHDLTSAHPSLVHGIAGSRLSNPNNERFRSLIVPHFSLVVICCCCCFYMLIKNTLCDSCAPTVPNSLCNFVQLSLSLCSPPALHSSSLFRKHLSAAPPADYMNASISNLKTLARSASPDSLSLSSSLPQPVELRMTSLYKKHNRVSLYKIKVQPVQKLCVVLLDSLLTVCPRVSARVSSAPLPLSLPVFPRAQVSRQMTLLEAPLQEHFTLLCLYFFLSIFVSSF